MAGEAEARGSLGGTVCVVAGCGKTGWVMAAAAFREVAGGSVSVAERVFGTRAKTIAPATASAPVAATMPTIFLLPPPTPAVRPKGAMVSVAAGSLLRSEDGGTDSPLAVSPAVSRMS